MMFWSPDGKIEANGIMDLKKPLLLHTPEDATPSGSVAPQIKDMKSVVESPIMGSPFNGQEASECRIKIKGMTCASCSQSVEHVLQRVDGVKNAVVGLALEEAKVQFPILIDIKRIIEAVEDAGFGAYLISSRSDMNKVHLKLEGVDSLDDVNVIVSSLNLAAGVNHVEMDLTEEHKVTVSYDLDIIDPRHLIQCIQVASSGRSVYRATLHTERNGKQSMYLAQINMRDEETTLSDEVAM